jgi:hypothetical protein
MQLEDVLELATRHGMERYAQKRAGVMLPLAVGMMIPGIVHNALERKRSTEHALDRATYDPRMAPPMQRIAAAATTSWLSRAGRAAPAAIGIAVAAGFGKEMGISGANLLRDIAAKAREAVGRPGDDATRKAIIGELKKNDTVLANADDKTLLEAYHTMSRFAPVLSTDKNAVRSFLRQAVMSGAGPDYMSIKLLADSERAVTGEKDKHR